MKDWGESHPNGAVYSTNNEHLMNRLLILRNMIPIMEAIVVVVVVVMMMIQIRALEQVMVIEKCRRLNRRKVMEIKRLHAERREQGKFLTRSDFMRETSAGVELTQTHLGMDGQVWWCL